MQASPFKVCARRAAARGFTIAELMAVVAIVGILSLIASVSYRKFVARSKIAEVMPMFVNIKAAEETFKDESFRYSGAANLSTYLPNNPKPGLQKMNFSAGAWGELNVQATGPVLFVYAVAAGNNSALPALGSDITVGNWPASIAAPWYVIKARANIYDDGVDTVFVSGSFVGDLYSAHD